MKYQTLIEISTGNVLMGGRTDLTKDPKYKEGETEIRTDGEPGLIAKGVDKKEWHNWNGTDYVLVDNSDVYDKKQFDKKRKSKFKEDDWRWDRYQQQNSYMDTEEETAEYDAWVAYWQALRDMPEQPDFDPKNPSWPVKPS